MSVCACACVYVCVSEYSVCERICVYVSVCTCMIVRRDVIIMLQNKDGKEFTGKQWPGIVVYPDFFKDNVTNQYWTNQVSSSSTI